MLRNYLTVAVRNLIRHKGYSAINILGLAVGMACCFLILLLVQDEMSYDRHHPKADRIYRVVWESGSGNACAPAILSPILKASFPEVEEVVRVIGWGKPVVSHGEKQFYEERFRFVDPAFFRIFSFPLAYGDPATALSEPNTVVITEAMARKYFGDESPMGKVLLYNNRTAYRVTGILKTSTHRSHIQFDLLSSTVMLRDEVMKNWGNQAAYTYVVLSEGYDQAELERKFPEFVRQHVPPIAGIVKLHLQPLSDIHLHSRLMNEMEPNTDVQYLTIFTAIAFLILAIACINFINLSTARSAHRAREVGMRKVLGASRLQLVRQFLSESVLMSLIAFALAISLVEVFLPGFNALFEKTLSVHFFSDGYMLVEFVIFALSVGVASGAYSAFFLSSFEPVQVLKGTFKSGTLNAYLRRGLVMFQFVISIGLIVSTVIIYSQLRYIQNKKLGFDKEQVVVVSNAWFLRRNYEPFKNELLAHPNVRAVTAGNPPEVGGYGSYGGIKQKDGSELSYYLYEIDYDYLKTLGIKLVAGRDFSRDYATDSTAVLVNEAYARMVGWDVRAPEHERKRVIDHLRREVRAVGVTEDFHHRSLHEEIQPLVLYLKPGPKSFVLVRIGPADVRELLAFLKKKWEMFMPDRPFEYSFLDEDIDRVYRKEQRLGRIFGTFSLLTVFVACLGLFGLAAFTAEQRTKEIGIRKVLGASLSNIVLLLSKELVMLAATANLIAWPIAYYAMRRWLQNFAYRIDLGAGVFILGGVLALVIALLTVSAQAIKAATANPVDALRYE